MKKTVVTLLMCCISIQAASAGWLTPSDKKMEEAVKSGDVHKVQKLLDKGGNANAWLMNRKGGNLSLLHFAIIQDSGFAEPNSISIQIALINAGADVESRNFEKLNTPLMDAAARNNIVVMSMLVEKGANVHARNKNNLNALHFAVMTGAFDAVMFLLNHGVDFNAVTSQGSTPLMLIAGPSTTTEQFVRNTNTYLNIAEELIKRGADINRISKNRVGDNLFEKTALSLAISSNKHELQDLLIYYGAHEIGAKDMVNQNLEKGKQARREREERLEKKAEKEAREAMLRKNAKPSGLQRGAQIFNVMTSAAKFMQSM